jgi:hypothetical protein
MHDDPILRASEYLTHSGIELSGPLTASSSDQADITAFVVTRFDSEKKQRPSNVQLSKISAELSERGIIIKFILINDDLKEIEGQVRANLLHQFGQYVRNSFLSTADGDAVLWLDVKAALEESVHSAIREHAVKLLDLYGIKLRDVALTKEENTPGKVAILSAVRRRSPVKLAALSAYLKGQGFSVPSDDWLTRRLDNLRRTGFVIRQHTGAYSLTSHALTTLGTTRTRRSPDIARILALGQSER